jgi:hypothetical protein
MNIDWFQRIQQSGQQQLEPVIALVEAADPKQTVSMANRLLCAGLSELAVVSARALGGEETKRSAEAAALLALVTKIDDQVIDAPEFHRDRRNLQQQTRAFLAPTLLAIQYPEQAALDPRSCLAARLGFLLKKAPLERRDFLLELIASGWEVQVRAVSVLTEHPRNNAPEEVEAVTTAISEAWLKMIACCGVLTPGTRLFTAEELAGFKDWGAVIQRADALTDLEKDRRDGHWSALPSFLWFQADAQGWEQEKNNFSSYYQAVARYQIDQQLKKPPPAALQLGELGSLLSWIQQFLLGRYHTHPLYRGV